MRAYPHRQFHLNSRFSDYLPDIWIDAPDEYYFTGLNSEFIIKNPWYKRVENLRHIPSSMFTGTKGRNPLLILNDNLFELQNKSDEKDLTIIYKIVERYFNSLSE